MAFRLRANELGLSMLTSANCTREICEARLNTCFGEFVLETKTVPSLLRVETDDPSDPAFVANHAIILGLPRIGIDDLAVEEAATELAGLVIETKTRS